VNSTHLQPADTWKSVASRTKGNEDLETEPSDKGDCSSTFKCLIKLSVLQCNTTNILLEQN